MTSTTTAVGILVAGILIALAMILRFLWCVYHRGGPKHVLDVARALRQVYDPNWPAKLLGYLPAVDTEEEGRTTASGPPVTLPRTRVERGPVREGLHLVER
jgi:hypothetical protein